MQHAKHTEMRLTKRLGFIQRLRFSNLGSTTETRALRGTGCSSTLSGGVAESEFPWDAGRGK